MNKISTLAILCTALAGGAAQASELGAQFGNEFQSAYYVPTSGGFGLTGDWLHSSRHGDDDQTAGLGLTFSLPLGSALLTAGAKAEYIDVAGHDEWALPIGGRVDLGLGNSFGVFAQAYGASGGMASGTLHSYVDSEIGARFVPIKPLALTIGYRYNRVEFDNGRDNRTLADGPYIGAALRF